MAPLASEFTQTSSQQDGAHQNDPPHREKVERTPGDERKGHGGPIWVIEQDGRLIGTSKREYDRITAERATAADASAADGNKEAKEVKSSG